MIFDYNTYMIEYANINKAYNERVHPFYNWYSFNRNLFND